MVMAFVSKDIAGSHNSNIYSCIVYILLVRPDTIVFVGDLCFTADVFLLVFIVYFNVRSSILFSSTLTHIQCDVGNITFCDFCCFRCVSFLMLPLTSV